MSDCVIKNYLLHSTLLISIPHYLMVNIINVVLCILLLTRSVVRTGSLSSDILLSNGVYLSMLSMMSTNIYVQCNVTDKQEQY